MAHVVIDARGYASSTGRYTRNLVTGLQRLDADNDFTVLMSPADSHAWKQSSPRFSALVVDIPPFTVREQVSMLKVLHHCHPDLVHFCMPQQPILWGGPSITTFHDLTLLRFRNPKKGLARSVAKRAAGAAAFWMAAHRSAICLTPSATIANDLRRFTGLPSDRVVVTYEAAEPIEAAPQPPSDPLPEQFLLYVGNQFAHKNLRLLIEAIALLPARGLQFNLVIAGDIDADVHRLASQRHVSPRVRMLGRVSDGTLRWLYEHAFAFVFPSLSEGFGLPGLEAMLYGCPVVSSSYTCLPEIYGDAAVYFDPTSVESLVSAIGSLAEDPSLRGTLIQRGFSQVSLYSWDRLVRQTQAGYRRVLMSSVHVPSTGQSQP